MITRRSILPSVVGIIAAPHVARAQFFNPPMFMPQPVSGFNPTSLITGNGGFWRADMGVTGTSPVTAWADQSSFANNLTSSTGCTFSATGFNSAKPGITIADAGNGLTVTVNYASATTTAFILLQYGSSNSLASGRLVNYTSSGQGDFNGANSFTINDDTNKFSCFANGSEVGNGGVANPALTANGLFLIGMVFDGANANKWTAGAVEGSGSAFTNNIGTGANGVFTLGIDSNSNAGGMTIAFAGLTQKAMNSTDWTNLKNFANSNWGTSF